MALQSPADHRSSQRLNCIWQKGPMLDPGRLQNLATFYPSLMAFVCQTVIDKQVPFQDFS
jgi:hypothetical protein